MKLKLIITLFILTSCAKLNVSKEGKVEGRSFQNERSYASVDEDKNQPDVKFDYDALYNDLEQFHTFIESNYIWREKAVEFYKTIENTKILTNEQIVTIHEQGTQTYLDLRIKLYKYIRGVEWVTNQYNKLIIDYKSPTLIIEKKKRIKRHKTVHYKKYHEIHINPNDRDGKVLIRQIKMGLAAALTLYDNYIIVVSQFAELDKIRHLIDYDNANKKYGISKIVSDFNDISNYSRIAKALRFYKSLEGYPPEAINPLSQKEEIFLNGTIENTHSYKELYKKFRTKIYKNKVVFIANFLYDYFKEVGNNVMSLISKGFGNAVGSFQSRNGKLYKLSDKKLATISAQLKPLDVLLEKTPFRLTDRFIPGHWGHVAIWTGTKEELIKLDLWEHPYIKPYQHEIEFENKRIIEALRPGVQINTLKHFMNIDDLAVVRYNLLNSDNIQKYLPNAFKQIGKEYDFNFDVETDERIVCSELAYVTFSDLDWNTERTAGRYTISPDNVGEKVTPNGEFSPVLLYHDGKEVKQDLLENFTSLLKTGFLN